MILSSSCGRYFSDEAHWTSESAGWASLHLRRYRHPLDVEAFETPPAADHILVLVTHGATLIESRRNGAWRSAHHVAGNMSRVTAGEVSRVRWRGPGVHETLQLHLPDRVMAAAVEACRDERSIPAGAAPISCPDPLVARVMLSLAEAAAEGAPELYAETAGHFLARHLLLRPGHHVAPVAADAARLRRVEEHMHAHLAEPVTLAELARVAQCSPFQLLRSCKRHWRQTPFQRLTSLRMAHGSRLLDTTSSSVTQIAFECGYTNPSHFAIAFRRALGVSPSDYRRR